MWRGTNGGGSLGPVNYSVQPGIHIWAEKPLSFGSIVIRSGMGKRAATHSLPLVPEQGHSGGPELLQYAAGCIRAGLAGDSWRDQQGLFCGRG